jgi:NADH:ubiquinone reductase (H+-translocating)
MTGLGTAEAMRNRVIERYEGTTLARGAADDYEGQLRVRHLAAGVEVASELHELIHEVLDPNYPNINPHRVRMVFVDRNEQVLKELNLALRRTVRKKLADLQIEVINKVKAQEITAGKVVLDDGWEIESENAIWTAGFRASEKLDDLDLPHDERKGLKVHAYMRVEGNDNVWGIGDCVASVDEDGDRSRATPRPPSSRGGPSLGTCWPP